MVIQIILLLLIKFSCDLTLFFTQHLVCSESKVCMIEDKVPVPPPLPTSPLPCKRNVPSSSPPVAVRQPRKTLCYKRTVRVLVTARVLLLLILVIADVVIAAILGRNTLGTDKQSGCAGVCVGGGVVLVTWHDAARSQFVPQQVEESKRVVKAVHKQHVVLVGVLRVLNCRLIRGRSSGGP